MLAMLHSALSCFARIHKFGRTQLIINIDSARVLLQCEVRPLYECTSCANSDVCSILETSLVFKKEIRISLDFIKCARFRANKNQ